MRGMKLAKTGGAMVKLTHHTVLLILPTTRQCDVTVEEAVDKEVHGRMQGYSKPFT